MTAVPEPSVDIEQPALHDFAALHLISAVAPSSTVMEPHILSSWSCVYTQLQFAWHVHEVVSIGSGWFVSHSVSAVVVLVANWA